MAQGARLSGYNLTTIANEEKQNIVINKGAAFHFNSESSET